MRSPKSMFVIVGLCAIACGGAQTMSPAAARIHEGSEIDVSDCQLIQKVEGTANDSDPNLAARHAKNAAMEEAARIGATHIKWIVPCCTSVEGNAYRCDVPE